VHNIWCLTGSSACSGAPLRQCFSLGQPCAPLLSCAQAVCFHGGGAVSLVCISNTYAWTSLGQCFRAQVRRIFKRHGTASRLWPRGRRRNDRHRRGSSYSTADRSDQRAWSRGASQQRCRASKAVMVLPNAVSRPPFLEALEELMSTCKVLQKFVQNIRNP
jgi:hypothetical protein